MKIRTYLTAAGAAVVLGTTGALVLPAIASANSATHTLKFISVQKATVTFSKTTQGEQDTDVNAAGKTIGFDELYFAANPTTGVAAANVTGDFNGGMLYGTFTANFKTGKVTNGKVTGGTGAFAGATGTIKVTSISSTKTAVTITYTG
jgi:hypothetical protein